MLIDIYNWSDINIWLNSRPLRGGGGRWLNCELDNIPNHISELSGIEIVTAGEHPVNKPEKIKQEEETIVILDQSEEIIDFNIEEPAPTIIEEPDTNFDDKLLLWGLTDIENLTVTSIMLSNTKSQLMEISQDLGIEISAYSKKLLIADAIMERILDVKIRGI